MFLLHPGGKSNILFSSQVRPVKPGTGETAQKEKHTGSPGKAEMTKDKVYNTQEVADILAIQKEAVGVLIRGGKIKGIKFGSRWRVAEDEIKSILGLRENQQQKNGKGI